MRRSWSMTGCSSETEHVVLLGTHLHLHTTKHDQYRKECFTSTPVNAQHSQSLEQLWQPNPVLIVQLIRKQETRVKVHMYAYLHLHRHSVYPSSGLNPSVLPCCWHLNRGTAEVCSRALLAGIHSSHLSGEPSWKFTGHTCRIHT